ncbi:MAG: helix-turn-helix domain-containing protein [Nitrososphaeraceae archaeon]|nr:helix-turn-helix domain-containing protein [Nitrososphaeraceae archaeon]MDW0138896.1 helix-turn-helix domain-containing protein [Nitrososphaeraceae archaeon]MDW0142311.1 helix-turn-helix domain-containing protein [Nitrososphaeraceae archaeon]MDW0145904.1 helix-turn-helix domain-containing protein [Nitrososphaeraceae archaeon]MDW0147944.1 helix-turn-helix domain-containing protein [Nitrososphaeraceae archaeon]
MENIKDALISKINLSDIEAQIFLYLIINDKTPLQEISDDLKFPLKKTTQLLNGLIEKGLILELSGVYQTFHPKFSIVNAYRLHCQKIGIEFKKNVQIDSLASSLERMHESARTKYGNENQ